MSGTLSAGCTSLLLMHQAERRSAAQSARKLSELIWGGALIKKTLKFHVRDVQKKHTEQEVISESIAYCSTGHAVLQIINV
jgi:hypothetical protein